MLPLPAQVPGEFSRAVPLGFQVVDAPRSLASGAPSRRTIDDLGAIARARDDGRGRSASSSSTITGSTAARASRNALSTSRCPAGSGVAEMTNAPTPWRRSSNALFTKGDCARRIVLNLGTEYCSCSSPIVGNADPIGNSP